MDAKKISPIEKLIGKPYSKMTDKEFKKIRMWAALISGLIFGLAALFPSKGNFLVAIIIGIVAGFTAYYAFQRSNLQ